jgi:polyhydroxyalkanoate synthesis regulator phasin
VRQAIRHREEEAARWRDGARADWDEMVHGAVERVFKALDLPRRSDIEALNENLERVAAALEQLDGERDGDEPPRHAAGDDRQRRTD